LRNASRHFWLNGIVIFPAYADVVRRTRALLVVGAIAIAIVAAVAAAASTAPSGEVYRVWLNGRRLDLSRSSADDTFPVASPNGKRVAFISDRSGGRRLFVVGSDGRGLEPVSGPLQTNQSMAGQVAWSPDSRQLAVALPGGLLYVLDPAGRRQRLVVPLPPSLLAPAWSPDGRTIAFDVGTSANPGTRVVHVRRKRSWRVRGRRIGAGQLPGWGWSATGRLAVVDARGTARVRVYGEEGRLRLSFPGRSYAWSLDGSRLASLTADRLEVRDLSGRVLFRKSVPLLERNQHNGLLWADGKHVLIGGTPAPVPLSVDVTRGRTSPGSTAYFGTLSPDRRLVAGIENRGGGFALTVSRLDGRGPRTVVRRRACPDLIEGDVQWLPDSRSLIYDFKCQP